MNRSIGTAWAAAAALLVLAGCGAQDGLAAAGGEVSVAPSAGVAADSGDASASDASAGDARYGLPCPASAAARPPVTPDGLPATTLPCLGPGPDVTLSGLGQPPTVLNVWASWCPPCRAEMPMLADLAADAGDQLNVLGVNVLDDRDAAADYAALVPLASVYDADGATRASLGWTGPPVTLFIDSSGRVVHRIIGRIPDEGTLRADVAQYLGVSVPND